MTPGEAARHVLHALEGGEPVAEVVVVASEAKEVPLGSRMVVWESRSEGTIGSGDGDRAAIAAARAALVEKLAGVHTLAEAGPGVAVYIDPHRPPEELVIVGAGHIARPLCRVGAMLGFRVIVLDDRPGFATRERFPEAHVLVKADFSNLFRDVRLGSSTHLVLVTRGHKYDFEVLRELLRGDTELAYIGMVGSQRRVRAALEQLVQEGIRRERLETVYAPIGLDIGAETPEEIAISVAAELTRLRRGGTGESLRDRARVLKRWLKE